LIFEPKGEIPMTSIAKKALKKRVSQNLKFQKKEYKKITGNALRIP